MRPGPGAQRRPARALAGAALLAALGLSGPGAAEGVFVRPKAAGFSQKYDTATVTLDLPPGVAIQPGTAEFRMSFKNTGRTRVERDFPLLPLGPPVALPGGGTRVTLSPGAAQGAAMMDFLREGGRLASLRLNPSRHVIIPSFKLCRTRSLGATGPAILTGQVVIELLPDMPPTRVDLSAAARAKGETLDQFVEPC